MARSESYPIRVNCRSIAEYIENMDALIVRQALAAEMRV
jgi:hypothetical protein